MGNVNEIKPKVKGHASFILRDGWVNKGLAELVKPKNEKIFTAGNAADVFGIGSNMVPALRYWLQCFNMVEEKPGKGTFLSTFGELVSEYDSYLEDIFTIWIMHSNISKNLEKATLFHDYFNDEKIQVTTREMLTDIFVEKWKEHKIPDASIKSDVDVLFNMYCKSKVNDDPEDKIVSPVNELLLIKKIGEEYKKVQPDLRTIPDEVILYELSVMFEREYGDKRRVGEHKALSIEKIAEGKYSLGAIYNLSRVATNQMLNRLESLKYIRVDRTAGLDVVYDEGIPHPLDIIREYYTQR